MLLTFVALFFATVCVGVIPGPDEGGGVLPVCRFMAANLPTCDECPSMCTLEYTVPNLKEKLEKQFDVYDTAKQHIKDNVKDDKPAAVTPEDWDKFLATDEKTNDLKLTDKEKGDIVDAINNRISKAKKWAKKNSKIQIDDFRKDADAVKDFCDGFPRIAITHIHPTGTRRRKLIKELFEKVDPEINGLTIFKATVKGKNEGLAILDPDEEAFLKSQRLQETKKFKELKAEDQQKFYDIFFLDDPKRTHDFKRFQAIFEFNKATLGTSSDDKVKENIKNMMYDNYLKLLQDNGVEYVEFTKSFLKKNENDNYSIDALTAMNDLMKKVDQCALKDDDKDFNCDKKRPHVHANFNAAFVRTNTDQQMLDDALRFVKTMDKSDPTNKEKVEKLDRLVGIDLLGNEKNNPSLEKGQDVYARVKPEVFGLNGMTMHSGELDPKIQNVRDAVLLGATRVGHGVTLKDDPVTWAYMTRPDFKKIPIVVSLVSNKRLRAIDHYKEHPFVRFLRSGIPVMQSTDNPGIFDTSISNECVIAVTHTDIQYEELKAISFNAIDGCFASPEMKDELNKRLAQKFVAFEKIVAHIGDFEEDDTTVWKALFGVFIGLFCCLAAAVCLMWRWGYINKDSELTTNLTADVDAEAVGRTPYELLGDNGIDN